MKKLMPLMALALVVLFGCAKEETTTAALSTNDQNVEESNGSAYLLNFDGETPVWEVVTLDELQSTQSASTSATARGNSVHTHGSFGPESQPTEWSGTENNGGPHGSAYLEFGPGQVTMETECIRVEGNEAVYGGIITEFVNPFGPFDVGWHLYIKVIDNGQGNNAPADQANGVFALTPPGPENSACGTITPSSGIFNIFPDFDIQEPGSVKVNN